MKAVPRLPVVDKIHVALPGLLESLVQPDARTFTGLCRQRDILRPQFLLCGQPFHILGEGEKQEGPQARCLPGWRTRLQWKIRGSTYEQPR